MIYKFFLIVIVCVSCGVASAAELTEGQIYRLERTFTGLLDHTGAGDYTATRPSKFIVVDNDNPDYYLIRFLKVHNFKVGDSVIESTVREDDEYRLPRITPNVTVEKSVRQAFSGPVSGPLVVPFKYRLDDKSITGDATLGLYAGYSFDIPIWRTNFRIPITPFVSGGLTQVSVVDENGESDSKSGFTWSAGLLIQNWGNLTIGIVYGQDRVGDQDFEHEGKGWFSFMIGWEI